MAQNETWKNSFQGLAFNFSSGITQLCPTTKSFLFDCFILFVCSKRFTEMPHILLMRPVLGISRNYLCEQQEG